MFNNNFQFSSFIKHYILFCHYFRRYDASSRKMAWRFSFLIFGILIGSVSRAPTSLNFLTKLASITKLQNFLFFYMRHFHVTVLSAFCDNEDLHPIKFLQQICILFPLQSHNLHENLYLNSQSFPTGEWSPA
jgi:hypothetical protein